MSDKLLIRCSECHKLMTEPKTKAAKEAGEMGQTTITYLHELWLLKNYGYREIVATDEMMKGNLAEQDAFDLVQDVLGGQFRVKNRQLLQNDYLIGTPDIILPDCIEDTKCSYTIKTFHFADISDNYLMQLQAYMALTGRKKARLIYCLVNTPDVQITEMKKRLYFRYNCDEENPDYIAGSKQIEKNHIYDNIPKKDRVKIFEFAYDPALIEKLYRKIEQARRYYDTITL